MSVVEASRSQCSACMAVFVYAYHEPNRGPVCPWCYRPLEPAPDGQGWVAAPGWKRNGYMGWKRRSGKKNPRRKKNKRLPVDPDIRSFIADHPGHPLGAGMPTGASLREDGESHREAWERILRHDVCAYCGGRGGTVDHLEPKNPLKPARGLGGKYSWLNLSGSCDSCNGNKGSKSLLTFLRSRGR